MTTTLLETSTPEPDPVEDAIAALTAVARRERPVGVGTANEQERADFGEIVCQVLAAVAANVGGIDTLLAALPESRKADYVRQMIRSAVGEDEDGLLGYRTEPLHLNLDVRQIFDDFGLSALYEEAAQELEHRETAADAALFDAVAIPAERVRMDEIRAAISNGEARTEHAAGLMLEAQNIIATITHRAEEEGNLLAATLSSAEDALETLEELWIQDQKAYLEAYAAAIRQAITARGLTITVEVGDGAADGAHLISEEMHGYARRVTPLPMTGEAPDPSKGRPAEAVRKAGLTYVARVHAQQ